MKALAFVFIFVAVLMGFIFAEPIGDMATSLEENSTGITATIYSYMDEMYAISLFGILVGSIGLFFYQKTRGRGRY
jgi:hypothetical protein